MATLHMASSDGFVTEGERLLADELRQLPDDWVVIANKTLPQSGQASREIDFIVVGDNHIFVLDDKGWSGPIYGSDLAWTLPGGASERSPLNKLDQTARIVAGFLDRKITDWRAQNAELVVSAVVLSRAARRPSLTDPRAARGVILLADVRNALLEWDAEPPAQRYRGAGATEAPIGYPKRVRRQIVEALFDLRSRPNVPTRINDYEIIGVTDGPAGARVLRARHPDAGERDLYVYDLAGDATRRELVQHEMATLQGLRQTGLVPEILDPFTWSEQFYVVPVVPPAGTSIGALPAPASVEDVRALVRVAAATMRALGRLHAAGVVHRALNPDRIMIGDGTEPAAGAPVPVTFTQFFAARGAGLTIAPIIGALGIADPYAAPEIIALGPDGYGFADASSDTYTLALIWLERLSGQRLAALRPGAFPAADEGEPRPAIRYNVRIPTADEGWRFVPEELLGALRDFFGRVLTAGGLATASSTSAGRLTADAGAGELDAMVADGARTDPEQTFSAYGPGADLIEGRYTVIRLLGAGASAQTYLVRDNVEGDRYAMKRLMHPSIMGESVAIGEFRTLKRLQHRAIPQVYDLVDPVHVKMEYAEGRGLREAFPELRGDLDRWRRVAGDLLSAIGYLESKGIQHRDVKPENVILRDDGVTVLVDFGIATRTGVVAGPAGTQGYLPPEALTALTPPDSVDRYASAVVLFEALFGRKPFAQGGGFVLEPITEAELGDVSPAVRAVGRVLLNAVAIGPAGRPKSAARLLRLLDLAMRPERTPQPDPVVDRVDRVEHDTGGGTTDTDQQAVGDRGGTSGGEPVVAVTEGTEKVNPTVADLRALFRNSVSGNADNRGLDSDFARETYVPTRLDTAILPAVLRDRPRAVFLSGNPGDGKTAFLEQIRTALRDAGGSEVTGDASGWEWTLGGHTFRAVYDASESHDGLSADEQVTARFRGLEGPDEPAAALTVLVAINDGRFVSLTESAADRFGWLTAAALAARRQPGALPSGGVWYLDLKRRGAVGLAIDPDEPSLLRNVLGVLVDEHRWRACAGCTAIDVCPIRRNALALRTGEGSPPPADRLEYLMRIAHLRGVRHLTIRDIRSGLAYLITGGRGCEDVHAALRGQEGAGYPADYWRTMFTTGDETDVMLGQFQPLDPARSPQPFLERYLYFHRDGDGLAARMALFADEVDVPLASLGGSASAIEEPNGTSDVPTTVAETEEAIRWVAAVKQRLFFHGRIQTDSRVMFEGREVPVVPWVSLLPYREYAGAFVNALRYPEEEHDLLPRILRGISRSDGVKVLTDGELALRVAESEENRLTIVKRFPVGQFRLRPEATDGPQPLETIPTALLLTYEPAPGRVIGRLRVTLDLFETLGRLADGQEPDAPELGSQLEHLVAFKSVVSRQQSRDFTLIEDHRRQHLLTQEDGRIILRIDVGADGRSEVRADR